MSSPITRRQHRSDAVDHAVQVDHGRLHHLLAAEREQLAGELGGGSAAGLHLAHARGGADSHGHPPGDQLAVAEDHGEQVVEVVRDAAGQLPDRFHLLRLPQLRFERPLQGDVALHHRGAHQPALAIANGRGGELDGHDLAVLPHAGGLVVVDRLARGKTRQDGPFLVAQPRRHQPVYGFTDHLVGGVAEDALSRRIPGADGPVEILADDRVVRRLHDGREPGTDHRGSIRGITGATFHGTPGRRDDSLPR